MEENKEIQTQEETTTEKVVAPAPKVEAPKQFSRPNPGNSSRDNRGGRPGRGPREFNKEEKKNLLEEKVVSISRVTKVTSGGRHFRFSATVVVGNRKGIVGIGTGKANEVPEAIKKGIQAANKNVVKIALIDGRTVPHEAVAKVGRALVLVKPAKKGTGIIAGGAARAVLELAGVHDIVSKSMGANTQINVAKATLAALMMQKTPAKIAALRGKTVEEL